MTVTRVGVPEFVREVHDAVVGLGEDDTTVLEARVESCVNAVTEMEAWQVTVYLSRPRGKTWDPDRLIELIGEVQNRTDDIASRRRLELEGTTMVRLDINDPRSWDEIMAAVAATGEGVRAVEEPPERG